MRSKRAVVAVAPPPAPELLELVPELDELDPLVALLLEQAPAAASAERPDTKTSALLRIA